MAYFLDLFTPETWSAFQEHGAGVSGFRYRQRRTAREDIKPGDIFLCYLIRLYRWCGVLRITSNAYNDDTPIYENPDPYVVRFKVEPIVILDPEISIPIKNDEIWHTLSITKDWEKGAQGWGNLFRRSLRRINDSDGDFLLSSLKQQGESRINYPLTDEERRRLRNQKARTPSGEVAVEIPAGNEDGDNAEANGTGKITTSSETRKSIQVQAQIAEIGAKMGFQIWVPRSDRDRVLAEISEDSIKPSFLEILPLNYDDTTLQTIEQIDVIWLKGRAMARAFEVEHTTAIYSGLLRMADLLALQPNMDIRVHIVAPDERREKVLREIKRPVFSLLERGPLYNNCTFLSYDALEELRSKSHLEHTNDSIIEEYEEYAEDF